MTRRRAAVAAGACIVVVAAVAVWRSGGGTQGDVLQVPTPGAVKAAFAAGAPWGQGSVPRQRFAWPVKPFHGPHVVRGTFGEPRGLLGAGIDATGGPRERALIRGDQLRPRGRRIIHTGIDVVAPDGTPVYAVESGISHSGGRGADRHVLVGRFGYWHLDRRVPDGTRVVAFRTVIGRVMAGQHHVHLTRFARPGGVPVNPLVNGGIAPYTDTAPPVIDRLRVFRPGGATVAPGALRGPVVFVVRAADVQSAGGTHTGLYTLGYSLVPLHRRAAPVVGPITTFRFDRLPTVAQGDVTYTAASTRIRFLTRFWYRLTDRSPSGDGTVHTETLPPGPYVLKVVASDARGNTTTRGFPVTVVPAGSAPASR